MHSWICYLLIRKNWLVTINGSLICSCHETVEFNLLMGTRKENSRVQTLDFRWTDFSLFRKIGRRVPRGSSEGQGSSRMVADLLRTKFSKGEKDPSPYLTNNVSGDQQGVSSELMTASKQKGSAEETEGVQRRLKGETLKHTTQALPSTCLWIGGEELGLIQTAEKTVAGAPNNSPLVSSGWKTWTVGQSGRVRNNRHKWRWKRFILDIRKKFCPWEQSCVLRSSAGSILGGFEQPWSDLRADPNLSRSLD